MPVGATDGASNTVTNNYQVAVSGPTSSTQTHDANGNMTSDGTNSYAWDAENRLIKVTYPGSGNFTDFLYDANGLQGQIVETRTSVVTSTKQFVRTKSKNYEERDAGNAVIKKFLAGGQTISSSNYFYTLDHLGSVREMTDSSGVVQARYEYDSYGQITKAGSLDSDFQYAGYYFHAPSGLNMTLRRAYNSALGRWISRDPIGQSNSNNLFLYVQNNPTKLVDTTGEQPVTYGRFGGSSWQNGTTGSELTNFPWRNGQRGFWKPISERDLCYYQHDVCLHNCARLGSKDPKKDKPDCRRQCRRNCDGELARCLGGVRARGNQDFPPTLNDEINGFSGVRPFSGYSGSPNDNADVYVPGLDEYDPAYNPGIEPQQ